MGQDNPIKLRPASLTGAQKRALRAQAHHLKAIVWVGQHGLTDTVERAILTAINDHELVKVSIGEETAAARKALAASIGQATGSHVVQVIGKVGIFYRQKKTDPVVQLPGVSGT